MTYILIAQDLNNVWEVVGESKTIKEGEKKAKGFLERGTAKVVRILEEKRILSFEQLKPKN